MTLPIAEARTRVLAAITRLESTPAVVNADVELLREALTALDNVDCCHRRGADDEPASMRPPVVTGTVLASHSEPLADADYDPVGSVFTPVLLPHDPMVRR